MFNDIWEAKRKSVKVDQSAYQNQIRQVEKKIGSFIEMIANATNPTAAGLYEKRSRSCCAQRKCLLKNLPMWVNLSQPLRMCLNHQSDSSETLTKYGKILISPGSERFFDRHFQSLSNTAKKEGYRTTKTALPFKVLEDVGSEKSKMVPRRGLEPPRPYRH